MENLSKEKLLKMYYYMVLTRRFEETMADLYHKGKVDELLHRSLGQEAIGVGATFCLRKDDFILPSLRTRAAFFTKGVDLNTMMAGLYRKRNSPSKGRESTHHAGIPHLNIILGTGVVGGHIPVAVGAALGVKLQAKDQVVVCFFGDGATSRGDFHEGVNLAAVLDLPVVFVCENNQYAFSTPLSRQTKAKHIADKAPGYGIPGVIADGQSVLDVYQKTREAVNRAREGLGPTLLECKTYRFASHSEHDADWDMGRPKEELERWRRKDPIRIYEEYLRQQGFLDDDAKKEIEGRIKKELEEAINYAEQSPDPRPEDLLDDVYA